MHLYITNFINRKPRLRHFTISSKTYKKSSFYYDEQHHRTLHRIPCCNFINQLLTCQNLATIFSYSVITYLPYHVYTNTIPWTSFPSLEKLHACPSFFLYCSCKTRLRSSRWELRMLIYKHQQGIQPCYSCISDAQSHNSNYACCHHCFIPFKLSMSIESAKHITYHSAFTWLS